MTQPFASISQKMRTIVPHLFRRDSTCGAGAQPAKHPAPVWAPLAAPALCSETSCTDTVALAGCADAAALALHRHDRLIGIDQTRAELGVLADRSEILRGLLQDLAHGIGAEPRRALQQQRRDAAHVSRRERGAGDQPIFVVRATAAGCRRQAPRPRHAARYWRRRTSCRRRRSPTPRSRSDRRRDIAAATSGRNCRWPRSAPRLWPWRRQDGAPGRVGRAGKAHVDDARPAAPRRIRCS